MDEEFVEVRKGRPKLNREILTIGLTITVTESENEQIRKLIEKKNISMNQFFRDLLKEEFDKN